MIWKTVDESQIRKKFSLLLFICSILVIFIHANNIEEIAVDNDPTFLERAVIDIETYWSGVTKIAVPYFFMISGFLFFRTFKISKLLAKWGGRFKTIIIPYIIWCTLYFLYYVAVTHIPAIRNIMSNPNVVELTFSNWVRHIVVDEYYTLWFLKNLIIFILLTPCLYYLLKNYSRTVPTGFIVLVGVIALSFLVKKEVISIGINIPSGLEIYMAGSYFGINHKDWICKANKTLSIVALGIVAVFFLTAFRWFSTPFQILFFISCWYALDLFQIKKTYWWMEITFFTYVAHDIPLESFEKIYFMIFGHSPICSLIDYAFMPLIVEVLLIAVAYILIKFTPKVWKVICGGRVPVIGKVQ